MLSALHTNARLAVGLYRVSTPEQGHSGLELDGQQASVQTYVEAQGRTLVAENSDVANGKDAGRPGFRFALARRPQGMPGIHAVVPQES